MLPTPLHPGLGDISRGLGANAVELHGLGLDAFGLIQEELQLVVDAGGQGFPTAVALAEVAAAFKHHGGAGVGQHIELQRATAVQADAIDLGHGDLAFEGHLGERHLGVVELVTVDGNLEGPQTVFALPLRWDRLADPETEGGDHAIAGGPVGLRGGGKPQAAGGGGVVPILQGGGRQRRAGHVAGTTDEAHELGRVHQVEGQPPQSRRGLSNADLRFEDASALGIEGARGEFHPTRGHLAQLGLHRRGPFGSQRGRRGSRRRQAPHGGTAGLRRGRNPWARSPRCRGVAANPNQPATRVLPVRLTSVGLAGFHRGIKPAAVAAGKHFPVVYFCTI